MQSLREIRELLAARGLTPRHRFGQNFLHDHGKIVELVDAAKLQPERPSSRLDREPVH